MKGTMENILLSANTIDNATVRTWLNHHLVIHITMITLQSQI